MNKKQLQARAKELGIDFVTRDSVSVLTERIAEAEQATPAKKSILTDDDLKEVADQVVAATTAAPAKKAIRRGKGSKPTAPKKGGKGPAKKTADNPPVAVLVEAIDTGDFGIVLEKRELTPGGLARQLGVEPAVVAKLASGKRQPRPNAPADSIAGKVAAWYAKEVG